MQPLPHQYDVTVTAREQDLVQITAANLNPLLSAPPAEFDGPGTLWSPETLLVAAVADCLALTFRAIARASKLRWTSLECDGTGTLDRSDGVTCFTAVRLRAHLVLAHEEDVEKAQRLLEKAEKGCLVGNSLKFRPTLETSISVEQPAILSAG